MHTTPAIWFPTVRCGTGTDVFTERLAEGLRGQGIRCEITWLPHRAEYAPWSVPVPKPPPWANIMHINSWLHPRFVPQKLPLMVTVHHSVHDLALAPYKSLTQQFYHRFWIKSIETSNIKRAHTVTAISRYTAQQITKSFGLSDVTVIYNGIDTNIFTPAPEHPQHRPFRLLYVGSWSHRKGVDLLAPIMEHLGADFELHYISNRAERPARFHLPANSRYLGRVTTSQLIKTFQEADALIFPSRLEGFGLVALEAMACGIPVITTQTSALPEIVQDGISGFLCPRDDIDAFTEAARKLFNDPILWQQMRHAARKRAESLFNLEKILYDYLTSYRDILNR